MEIIISVAAKIEEYTAAAPFSFLFSYTTNKRNLTKQMDDLRKAKAILQDRVNIAANNNEEIHDEVKSWLRSFDEVSSEADTFLNHDDHAKVVCSCRSFLHLSTRRRLSWKAKKMSIRVCQLLERSSFDMISYSLWRESSFDSRKGILEDIKAAMRDPNRRRIGLCGMGGIGKTMLAKEIARLAEEAELFGKVVLAPISQTPNLKEIQQHIADMLQLKFGETDNSLGKRATFLQQQLKPENKILLILDDIWNKFDLQVIGIHEECKMLLISRFKNVLRNDMGIAENDVFNVETLEYGEAINLFKKIIGVIVEHPDYEDLARDIVQECQGLPITIATVAHALKSHVELSKWKDVLQQLQSSKFAGIDGMDDKVYSSIKMSYDFLRNLEAKSLLLLCALHKKDEQIQIEDLMRYNMSSSFLQNINTVSEARDRVNSLVDDLKSRCLLLDGWRKGFVKIHDVIRDVCISIARKEDQHRMNNITNAKMYEEFVKDKTNKGCKAISFLDYEDDKLPGILEYPALELLLMSGLCLKSIPDYFFEQTRKLKALGMSDTYLKSLPSSFQLLRNLQSLCLGGSSLEDIAMIGELMSLKVLDLSNSRSIKLLPKEIGQLRRLQLLDLQGCDYLRVIEPNVISNLTEMEELYLPKEFQGWETEEDSMKERSNASLEEIKSLQKLAVLYLSVQSANILPKEMFSEKLERYRVSIGGGEYVNYNSQNETPRWLHLNLSPRNEIKAFGLESLVKRTEYLSLERLIDVTNIAQCSDEVGFPRLKHLRLKQLPHLERLGHGNLPARSFNELRKVEVWNCRRLRNLFPLSVAKQLHEIRVEECEMMEEIVGGYGKEDEGDDEAALNKDECLQLRSLSLHSLPSFVQFYRSKQLKTTGESSPIVYSKPLFSDKVPFDKLEELTMSSMNIEIFWPEQLQSNFQMQNLRSLEVRSCTKLKYLFSFSIAQRFVSLRRLKVRDCKIMEVIGVKLGEEETQFRVILFPNLESLELIELSALQEFCATDSYVEFPLLSMLIITGHPKHKTVDSFLCVPIQVSFHHRDPFFNKKIAFPNLQQLIVKDCTNLKYLFSSTMVLSLQHLKFLKVIGCMNMEGIIVTDEESSRSTTPTFEKIFLLKLDSLELQDLPNLTKFCEGEGIECPLLSKLVIVKCPKLKEFTSNSYAISEGKPKQGVFKDKVKFPNLKVLWSDWSEAIKEIFEISSESTFDHLSHLKVICKSHDEPIALNNFKFLHKYRNMDKLELSGRFVDGADEAHEPINTTTHVTSLHIYSAEMLNHLFGDQEYAQPSHTNVFENLKSIQVWRCGRLQSFAPSFMSFQKLETLEISGCHGLTSLFAPSAATTLVQLKEMKIYDCHGMKQIIDKKGQKEVESEHRDFIFQELKKLELHDLLILESFYPGKEVMSFHNLEELSLKRCPKLRTFTSGIINIPASFHTIQVDGGRQIWDRDVNTTVRKLFRVESRH